MPRARELDAEILIPLYNRWKSTSGRSVKGEIINEACALWGITKPVIYKAFNRIDIGYSGFEVAKGVVPRKKSMLRQNLEQNRIAYAKKIATYKYASRSGQKGYVIPTERAIEIAIADGAIKPEEALSRSETDRWLKRLGISNRDFSVDKSTAISFVSHYANEVWFIDATPLNMHFLQLGGGIVHRPDLNPSDKHLSDILQRDGLFKIWVFYAIDLFSKAYFCYAFAPEPTTKGAKHGGENAFTWMQFLDMAFLPKDNYPFEGLPEIIYSDRFSGIKSASGPLRNYLSILNIRSEVHLPGNSRAKGLVEGRQSAFKRSYETVLNLFGNNHRALNLNSLNRYVISVSRKQNFDEKKFAAFIESAKQKPLRKVTAKNLQDARVRFVPRKLDAYKCVSVKWDNKSEKQKYFIEGAADFERGATFHLFRNVDGKVKAQDPKTGRLYDCDPRGALKVHFGEFKPLDDRHGLAETDAERNRKEIIAGVPAMRRAINFEAIFPAITNITVMRPQGDSIETNSIIAPDTFASGDEARAWLAITSGMALNHLRSDVRERIDDTLNLDIKLNGSVSRQTAEKLLESLIIEREQNNKVKESI